MLNIPRKKSTFFPRFKKGNFIETFEKMVKEDIHLLNIEIICPKKTPEALNNLRDNTEIVIKPANKGGGVILNKKDYIEEIQRKLSDITTYKELSTLFL